MQKTDQGNITTAISAVLDLEYSMAVEGLNVTTIEVFINNQL